MLGENRAALDALAQSLLEKETINGDEAGRIMDEALGRSAARSATPASPPADVRSDAAAIEVTPAPPAAETPRRRRGFEPGPAFS